MWMVEVEITKGTEGELYCEHHEWNVHHILQYLSADRNVVFTVQIIQILRHDNINVMHDSVGIRCIWVGHTYHQPRERYHYHCISNLTNRASREVVASCKVQNQPKWRKIRCVTFLHTNIRKGLALIWSDEEWHQCHETRSLEHNPLGYTSDPRSAL